MQKSSFGFVRDLGALGRALFAFSKSKMLSAGSLVLLASIFEGLGLFLIFPLVGIIFSDLTGDTQMSAAFEPYLRAMGLETTTEKLWFFSGVYLTLIILRAIVMLARDVRLSDLQQNFVNHERMEIYRTLAYAPWPRITELDRAEVLGTLMASLNQIGTCLHYLFNGTMNLIQIVVLLAVATAISPILTLAVVAVGLVAAILAGMRLKSSHSIGQDNIKNIRHLMFQTTTFLEGLKPAKVYHAEDAFLSRFHDALDQARIVRREFVEQQGLMRRSLEILSAIVMLAIFLTGYLVLDISVPALVAVAAILLRLSPQLIALASGAQLIVNAAPAFTAAQKVKAQIEAATEGLIRAPSSLASKPAVSLTGPITFSDIEINVPDGASEKCLLKIESLELPQNGLVIIRGPSGAGKSTFADLLCGLRLPSVGSLSVSGTRITTDNLRDWQSAITLQTQEPFLFRETLLNNLAWPMGELDEADAWAALKAADAESIAKALPQGLHESLRDGGLRLSGGERQRICLARSFARPANLYVLDEPTANLDRASEARILTHLRELSQQALIVMISHNPDLLAEADQVITIENGQIVA